MTSPAPRVTVEPSLPVIRVRGLSVGFGMQLVLNGLDLDVRRGEILGVVGGSGTGKSVLLRSIVGLSERVGGTVEVLGVDLTRAGGRQLHEVGRRWGVLFQQGALFSSLTVLENVMVPMREHMKLPKALAEDLAYLKLAMAGLDASAADKYPAELSGGMIKRVALARALALDPEIVFLDEPTAGLDPIGADAFDRLIANLREMLGLTVFMVTHDLDSLIAITDRIAVLGKGKVMTSGTFDELKSYDDPWVNAYFNGPRAARGK